MANTVHLFRLDCQSDLSTSISKLNPKSKLFLIREAPQTLLPKLFKAWKISHLVFEKDTDAYARERDEQVMKLAKEAGVEVIVKMGRTLYDPDALVKANNGKPTMSITQVQHVREHREHSLSDLTSGLSPTADSNRLQKSLGILHGQYRLLNHSPILAILLSTSNQNSRTKSQTSTVFNTPRTRLPINTFQGRIMISPSPP